MTAEAATELGAFRLGERVRGPFAGGAAHQGIAGDGSSVVVTTFDGNPPRFLADVALLKEAGHRALPQVLDWGVDDGTAWVATAPVGGRPLAEMIGSSGQLAPMPAVRLIGEIADALEQLHRVELVHGGLSPASILVGTHPVERPVLVGLSPGGEAASEDAAAYRAPELSLDGRASVSGDDYSLSLILLEALSGRRGGGDGLPPGLEGVFERALAPDPTRRTGGQEVVSETARALMSGRVSSPPHAPEPAVERAPRAKRSGGLLGALGLTAARRSEPAAPAERGRQSAEGLSRRETRVAPPARAAAPPPPQAPPAATAGTRAGAPSAGARTAARARPR